MTDWDLAELALHACGFTEQEIAIFIDGGHDVGAAVWQKLGVSLEDFATVADVLIKFTPPIRSPVNNIMYRGFGKVHEDGYMVMIAKERYHEED